MATVHNQADQMISQRRYDARRSAESEVYCRNCSGGCKTCQPGEGNARVYRNISRQKNFRNGLRNGNAIHRNLFLRIVFILSRGKYCPHRFLRRILRSGSCERCNFGAGRLHEFQFCAQYQLNGTFAPIADLICFISRSRLPTICIFRFMSAMYFPVMYSTAQNGEAWKQWGRWACWQWKWKRLLFI